MIRIAIVLLVSSCGDNLIPSADTGATTWRDAEQVWAESWCTYAARCFPVEFAEQFADVAACATAVVTQNCAVITRKDPCDTPYPPDRDGLLDQCRADMERITCSAVNAPGSCVEAFR